MAGEASDSGYDLMVDLFERPPTAEPPLDKAMRTNDQALRCYYEEHGEKATKTRWHTLSAAARAEYKRLPIVTGTGLGSGSFFVRDYNGTAVQITDLNAREHPMFAYQAM